MRSITGGCSSRNPSSCGPGSTRQRRSVSARTSAIGTPPIEDGDLAEEVATTEPCALLAVDDDRGVSLDDDVEGASRDPLAQDTLALGEDLLVEGVGDGLELRPAEIGEERELCEPLDGLGRCHQTSPPR